MALCLNVVVSEWRCVGMVLCRNGVVSELHCVGIALCQNGDMSGYNLLGYVIHRHKQTDDQPRYLPVTTLPLCTAGCFAKTQKFISFHGTILDNFQAKFDFF